MGSSKKRNYRSRVRRAKMMDKHAKRQLDLRETLLAQLNLPVGLPGFVEPTTETLSFGKLKFKESSLGLQSFADCYSISSGTQSESDNDKHDPPAESAPRSLQVRNPNPYAGSRPYGWSCGLEVPKQHQENQSSSPAQQSASAITSTRARANATKPKMVPCAEMPDFVILKAIAEKMLRPRTISRG